MTSDTNNALTAKTHRDENVLAYLVEQYGETVKALVDETENSYVKLKFKGEKDDIAQFVEGMHYHPLNTHAQLLNTGQFYLSTLVHDKIMAKLFQPRIEDISLLLLQKNAPIGQLVYVVGLKENSFEIRDSLRRKLLEVHDCKPYAKFISVDLEFLPEGVSENDLDSEDLVNLELGKNGEE